MSISLEFVGIFGREQNASVTDQRRRELEGFVDAVGGHLLDCRELQNPFEAAGVLANWLERMEGGFSLVTSSKEYISTADCLGQIVDNCIPVIVLPKPITESVPVQKLVQWALSDYRSIHATLMALDSIRQKAHRELQRSIERDLLSFRASQDDKAFRDFALPYFREAIEAEGKNLNAIARFLNERGVGAPKGGLWHATSVSRFIGANSL